MGKKSMKKMNVNVLGNVKNIREKNLNCVILNVSIVFMNRERDSRVDKITPQNDASPLNSLLKKVRDKRQNLRHNFCQFF